MALKRRIATVLARLIVVAVGLSGLAISVTGVVIAWQVVWAVILMGLVGIIVGAASVFMIYRGVFGADEEAEETAQEFLWKAVFRILFEGLLGG